MKRRWRTAELSSARRMAAATGGEGVELVASNLAQDRDIGADQGDACYRRLQHGQAEALGAAEHEDHVADPVEVGHVLQPHGMLRAPPALLEEEADHGVQSEL